MFLTLALAGTLSGAMGQAADTRPYTDQFNQDSCTFQSSGRSKYFILEPGYHQVLKGIVGGDTVTVVITVLAETRRVGAAETRIVEERETVNGQLREVSRNFLARCSETGSFFYFGEEVDNYKNGKIAGHEGTWLAGGKNRAGILVPGKVVAGDRYYQEIAPKTAMDRAEILSLSEVVQVPAGRFERVLKTVETTPLDPSEKSIKFYAPGIGLIKDGPLELVEYGYPGQEHAH